MACVVTRYTCTHNAPMLETLARNANAQMARNDGFRNIYPWKKQCAEDHHRVHYIARSPTGIICGWMTTEWKKEFGQQYVYLSEISTRRIKDELYGGVGQRLHVALLADAQAANIEFIYLYPLNPAVADIYKKWGYIHTRPELTHMFLMLRSHPNNRMLDGLMPPNPRLFMAQAHAIAAKHPKDDALLALMDKTRRAMIKQPEKIRELSQALDMILGTEYLEEQDNVPEMDRLPLEEKRSMLTEIFNTVKVGGYTRKQKRKYRY